MMRLIIEYVYTRKATLTADSVVTLLPIADNLLMPGLHNACCQYLISQLNPDNCVGIMKFARRNRYENLHEKTRLYILKNFRSVAKQSTEFLELDVETLSALLSNDTLYVKEEEEVYEAIMRWVDYSVNERLSSIPGLLLTVRLGLVQFTYFLDCIGGHKYIKNNEACAEIIQRAWDILYCNQMGLGDVKVPPPQISRELVQPRIPRDVVFIVGGWSAGAPISYFETYDPRADRWFAHSSLEDDSPRAYHGLVALGHKIYLVGGFDGNQYYNSTRMFNALTSTWHEVAPMHVRRCYVSAVELDGCIYALGGFDGRERLSVAERYVPTTNQWSMLDPMPSRRSDAGAVALRGKVYVVGGFDGDRCLDTVDVYDPVTLQWTVGTATMTKRRSGVSAVCHGGAMYALGGFDGERRLASVERYCPKTARWTSLNRMLATRSNFTAVVLDGCIIAIGGFNGRHTIPSVERFDPETNEWTDVSDMNISRSALKACVLSDLPNAADFTFHGHVQRKLRGNVGGDL